jgi:phage tail-like protein
MANIDLNRSALQTDPIRNFRFLVKFIPLSGPATNTVTTTLSTATLGFTSVSGLAVTTDSIPYREGGYNTTVHQIPGQTSFQPITLQHGVLVGNVYQWNWMRQLFATVEGGAGRGINENFRCDIEISVLPHPINSVPSTQKTTDTAMRFRVYNAWPTSVAYSDLNAGDNSLLVEQMTLIHEGFDVRWGDWDATTGFTSAATTFTTTNG